jgi:hypothetical protein
MSCTRLTITEFTFCCSARYCSISRARFFPRVTAYGDTVKAYAAQVDYAHDAALAALLDVPQLTTVQRDIVAIPPKKGGLGIPRISATAPGACLASLGQARALLIAHLGAHGMRDAVGAISACLTSTDDPLGAQAALAEIQPTYDWLTHTDNAHLINPHDPPAAAPPHKLPATAEAVVTSEQIMSEKDFAELTNAKLLAQLNDSANPHMSHGRPRPLPVRLRQARARVPRQHATCRAYDHGGRRHPWA